MKETNSTIDQILDENLNELGNHYSKYKNHVYRVFALCQKLDNREERTEKYAIASAFHDIGIWTNKSFDYLEPSIQKAKEYLLKIGKEDWIEEISLMIDMHHKRSIYKGPYNNTVETFRKADWIDVTKGLKSFSLSRNEIGKISNTYPNLGFHRFLMSQTIKNLIKSPLNPLPMFKK